MDPEAPNREALNRYTVLQLKDYCSSRGLETNGRKSELVERLGLYISVNPDDDLAVELEQAEEEAKIDQGEEKDGDGEEIYMILDEADDDDDEDKGEEIEKEEGKEEEKEGGKEDKKEEKKEDEKEDKKDENEDSKAEVNGIDEKAKDDEKEKPKTDTKGPTIYRGISKFHFRNDRAVHGRVRTILVGPIKPDLLAREEIINLCKASLSSNVKFTWDEEKGIHQGYVEYRFKTVAEAVNAEKNFPKFDDDVKVIRLTETVTYQTVMNKDDKPRVGPLEIRTIAVWNIPKTIDNETLTSLFADVHNKLVIHNSEDLFQGTIYLHYNTIDEAKKALETFQEKDMIVDGTKINFGMLERETRRGRDRKDSTSAPNTTQSSGPNTTQSSDGNSELISPEDRDKMMARINGLEDRLKVQRLLHPNTKRRIQKQIQGIQAKLERDHQLRVEKGLTSKKRRQRNRKRSGMRANLNQPEQQGQQQQQQKPKQQQEQQQKPKREQQSPNRNQQTRQQQNRQQRNNRQQQQKRRIPQQQNQSYGGGMMNTQQIPNQNFGEGMMSSQFGQQMNTGTSSTGALDLLVGLSSMLSSNFQRPQSTFQQQQPSQSFPNQNPPSKTRQRRNQRRRQKQQNVTWEGGAAVIDRQGSYGGQRNQSFDDYEPASKRQSLSGNYRGEYGNRSSSPVGDSYNYNNSNYRYDDDDDVNNFSYSSTGGNYRSTYY